ncbi:hypothetical protein H8N03_25805 [Ramlibacter sp. USB13]|uniref:Uncharacterized protein n=1 Tax=Ramlibacter cellulosilyticus TaxID=2764187 RepID=A0A923MYC4_9BURK|nr:hypothetical protein [Ramlibacter cellulosilyticus]MBC5786379.1 hypothetical protein [Ramlibacter cellulosilyticus]
MAPEQLEKSLREHLRSCANPLKSLGAADVLRIATEHWASTHIDGVWPNEGDGLVAYFELLDRGRGLDYEFGVNRILRTGERSPESWEWPQGFKLRLSVGFKTTLEIFQLKPAVAAFDCWNKQQVQDFISAVEGSPSFQIVSSYRQRNSGISFAECPVPPGPPRHPTKELTWAIA